MNKVSADVSKRLQEMVASQLDNIKKYNDQRDVQDKKIRDDQTAIVEAKNAELQAKAAELRTRTAELQAKAAELEKLKIEIAAAEDRSNQLAVVSRYNDAKAAVKNSLGKGFQVADEVLDLLGDRLQDKGVEPQAIKDAADPSEPWDLRVALYLQLFKRSSNVAYLESARALTFQNKASATSAVAGLFHLGYGSFSNSQTKSALPVAAALALDSGFPQEFRDSIFRTLSYTVGIPLQDALGAELADKLTRSAGDHLVKTTRSTRSVCHIVMQLLELLSQLSPDAKLRYAESALVENSGGRDKVDQECVKTELEKAISRRPTQETVQRRSAPPTGETE